MHKFLRTIGFSQLQTNADTDAFLFREVISEQHQTGRFVMEGSSILQEYRVKCAENVGLCAVTEQFPSGRLQLVSYFPYLYSEELSSNEICSIERHTATETFGGFIDDYRSGISLIFFLSNPMDYLKLSGNGRLVDFRGCYLSAFSAEGRVLLPILKQEESEAEQKLSQEREQLSEAARNGDEQAIELLTEADMNAYSEVMKRAEHEDIYSIVSSSCIPSGVECDLYSVLGEITGVSTTENRYTGEKLYRLELNCNDVIFPMVIGENCLEGVPETGRRFKGKIWLQGRVNFENPVVE